jgi:hypothetical protein
LDRRGLLVNEQLVCAWKGGTFDLDATNIDRLVLRSADAGAGGASEHECPADLPIKSFTFSYDSVSRSPYLFIEITRLDGLLVEIRLRGAPYYFSLKSLPGAQGTPAAGYRVTSPAKSPPLLGVVDIPAVFRPSPAAKTPRIALRLRPRADSPGVATIGSVLDFDAVGLGEGTLTAAVYARSNRWSLLRLIDGRTAWLGPDEAGKFASLERVLHNNATTTYMSSWDRVLAKVPGGERFTAPRDPRRVWIGYLEPRTAAQLSVFAKPDRTSEAAGELSSMNPRETLETISATAAAGRGMTDDRVIVFSRRPGWFEVALEGADTHERSERVWLEDSPSVWEFHEVSAGEADRLLIAAWGREKGPAVTITETRHVQGSLWLHVEILIGRACDIALGDVSRVVVAQGWLPAHDVLGYPTVWFETYCD